MEIKTLRYFLAVAREENMTRAAAFLHVTQPTLSKALKALDLRFYLIWSRYQTFTPIAERFLKQISRSFGPAG